MHYKHLEHATGCHICVPEVKVQQFGSDFLEPTYGEIISPDGTSADIWTRDVCTAITKKTERLAEQGGFEHIPDEYHLNHRYKLSHADESLGIDFITGGDHASHDSGVFHQVGRLNFSLHPREKNRL